MEDTGVDATAALVKLPAHDRGGDSGPLAAGTEAEPEATGARSSEAMTCARPTDESRCRPPLPGAVVSATADSPSTGTATTTVTEGGGEVLCLRAAHVGTDDIRVAHGPGGCGVVGPGAANRKAAPTTED